MTNDHVNRVYAALRIAFGVVPIVAGLDKFTNLLTDWAHYLPAYFTRLVPIGAHNIMLVIGVVEIIAGVLVLSRLTRLGAAIVAAWLVLVAANVALAGFFDIAVRDLVMALAAYGLAELAAARGQAWLPGHSERALPVAHNL